MKEIIGSITISDNKIGIGERYTMVNDNTIGTDFSNQEQICHPSAPPINIPEKVRLKT